MKAAFKVLIVDDEPWVLDGLRDFIPWQDCGFQVCGCAADGAEALQAVERLRPDLVMTDINMPGVDGLKFMEQVRTKVDKEILFLVLSGYNRFDYMSEAMSYGIIDYLLKPLYPQEVIPALKKACAALEDMHRREHRLERAQAEQFQNDFNMMTSLDHVEMETRQCFADRLGFSQDDPVIPLLLRKKLGEAATKPWTQDDCAAMAEAISSCFSPVESDMIFLMDQTHAAFLVAHEDSKLEKTAAKLLQRLQQTGLEIVNISIGLPCTIRKGLSESFQQARLMQLMSAKAVCMCQRDMASSPSDAAFTQIKSVISAISSGDQGQLSKSCAKLFQLCRQSHHSRRALMDCSRVLIGEISMLLLEADAADRFEPSEWLAEQQNIGMDELEKRLLGLCQDKMERLQSKVALDGGDILSQIQRYVPTHLQEPLTISVLAEMFHVNPVYLGKLIKRNTGHSLATLVCQNRVAEAKRLLRNTTLSVQQISRQVGFQDASYFTKKFKELEGMLPSDYRGE